jgi:hypothetical protein
MGLPTFQQNFTYHAGLGVQGRLLIRDWLVRAARVFLVVGLSLCACLIFVQTLADRYSQRQTVEGFRMAIQWEPWNPEYRAGLARALQRPLKPGDLPEVISSYEKAIQLSPQNATYWARLGQAYDWAGRGRDARIAYERARFLYPNSPAMNWAIGNFYFREGKMEQALHAVQKAVSGDPDLRRPAFDLAWRATADGDLIAREMIPPQADIYFSYLDYLLATERLGEATKVWGRLIALGLPFNSQAAFPYLDALIQRRQIHQLTSAWSVLRKRNPSTLSTSTHDINLVTNGDFESQILNGGLDWRINPTAGAVVSLDSLTFFDGLRSLRISFDGKQNISDALIFQYVPVKPNTFYLFNGHMRAQGITTDSGPRFQIRDADDPDGFFLQSEGVVGNSPWLRQELEFKSAPDTRLLEIRVARPSSAKFDGRIAGTVWVDQVALQPMESAPRPIWRKAMVAK